MASSQYCRFDAYAATLMVNIIDILITYLSNLS